MFLAPDGRPAQDPAGPSAENLPLSGALSRGLGSVNLRGSIDHLFDRRKGQGMSKSLLVGKGQPNLIGLFDGSSSCELQRLDEIRRCTLLAQTTAD